MIVEQQNAARITISLTSQRLRLVRGQQTLEFPISTARNGPGELLDSGCTPTGAHIIRAKIGTGLAMGTVFSGRRSTGEIYSPQLAARHPHRDWILTRILWLSGLEVGRNRLGNVDTMRRFIYIHGTPHGNPMGIAASHGCIRMRNTDVIALFDRVACGTPVDITCK